MRDIGLAFDPVRREERFEGLLARPAGLRDRLRQAQAFVDDDPRGYVPQDPKEIVADVLSLLRYMGVKW
jgi:hypothetical protein